MDSARERAFFLNYFQKRLAELRPELKGTPSYEGDTSFDLICYRLEEEAVRLFRSRFGYVPPLGTVRSALLLAHFAKMRSPLAPMKRYLRRLFCLLRLALF